MARPITYQSIVKKLEAYALQKDKFIMDLGKVIDEKDKEIARLKKNTVPNKNQFLRKFKRNKEMVSVFHRWNKIKEIVKNRKSAYDINEYLELKTVIDFDDE